MIKRRLRHVVYFVGAIALAIFTPIDEILIVVAVSSILYRFVRRKYGQYRAQASGVSRTDTNRR